MRCVKPLFMAYRDGQPFNDNQLRPCPMLENPELLREMVHKTGAKSTDLQSPESVDHLCDKCKNYAENWAGRQRRSGRRIRITVESFHNYKSTYQD